MWSRKVGSPRPRRELPRAGYAQRSVVRIHTGYARAGDEAHTLVRQALTGSGDIDPGDGVLTVRLDPLPTQRATTAIAQLCEHLTATQTRYPGTNLILRYEVKIRP